MIDNVNHPAHREILFRGKRADNGEWVEGDLVRLKDGTHIIPNIYGFGKIKLVTVGQYTGLKDKNGTKIFEGDIVNVDYTIGVVKYGDFIPKFYAQAVFHSSPIKGFYVETINGDQLVLPSKARANVIGNIHDNPELLDVKLCSKRT